MAQFSKTLTGTITALGSITNTRGKKVLIKVVTSGTETVSVAGIVDGTVSTTGKILFYSILTGALHSTADMDDGTFYIPMCYTETLVFTGSSTSDTKTVTIVVFD